MSKRPNCTRLGKSLKCTRPRLSLSLHNHTLPEDTIAQNHEISPKPFNLPMHTQWRKNYPKQKLQRNPIFLPIILTNSKSKRKKISDQRRKKNRELNKAIIRKHGCLVLFLNCENLVESDMEFSKLKSNRPTTTNELDSEKSFRK